MATDPTTHADSTSLVAKESLRLEDESGRQRLLATTTKPPAINDGVEYERGGDDNSTYVVFNDETGTEGGGIIVGSSGAMLSLDWKNQDAIHLETEYNESDGRASLLMTHMPDPSLPSGAKTTLGLSLHCSTEYGTGLQLCDSHGSPRIVLQVDTNDVASIQILDEQGTVILRLPPE